MNSEKSQVFHRYFSALGDLFSPFFFAVVSMAPCFAEIWGNDQKTSIFLDWEQVGTYKLLRGKQKCKGDIQTWRWAPGDAVQGGRTMKSHELIITLLVSPGFSPQLLESLR